jgi:hypothetical protein
VLHDIGANVKELPFERALGTVVLGELKRLSERAQRA